MLSAIMAHRSRIAGVCTMVLASARASEASSACTSADLLWRMLGLPSSMRCRISSLAALRCCSKTSLSSSSDGGNHSSPSCCSWMSLSACSSRNSLDLTLSSCIPQTSSNRRASAVTKRESLSLRSMSSCVYRLKASLSSTFSLLNLLSIAL